MLKETTELKLKLFNLFNELKDIEAGINGEVHDAVYLRYKGKPYAVHLIKMEDDVVTEKDRKHYVHISDNRIKDYKNLEKLKYLIPKNNFLINKQT